MPTEPQPPLTDHELDAMECRASAFACLYRGTAGTLAADVMRLLGERQRLVVAMAMLREQHSIERYKQQRGRD